MSPKGLYSGGAPIRLRKSTKDRARFDTPPAGPVRITNLSTGETRTEPPLSQDQRRKLAKQNKASSKRKKPEHRIP